MRRECNEMHYVTSDIHNDNERLKKLLEYLNLQEDDKLYILGDLFDRSNHNADPIGVYFTVLALRNKCQVIRGNHEQDLAEYIGTYYQTPERKRTKLDTYPYNTFELLQERLTPVDIQNIAKWIENFAKERGLKYRQDEYNNVIIFKEASSKNKR